MLIRVVYDDFRYDFVKPFCLNELLTAGRISMFRRSSGWVLVGIDPVREPRSSPARRIDRRQSWKEHPQ